MALHSSTEIYRATYDLCKPEKQPPNTQPANKEIEMNNLHPAYKITIKHRYTTAVLFEYTPTDEQQASG
ncbi:MAG: hypothetical protein WAU24_09115, partial [Chitinophagaceae bacterium]